MENEVRIMAPRSAEVPMVEQEIVRQMRLLSDAGWGAKRIARELGIARNTVRRYLRGGEGAEHQSRPAARLLTEEQRAQAVALWQSEAEHNAVVVRSLLVEQGVEASLRTVQRVVAPERQQQLAADLASVRFETAPGKQMQIDFGQKRVRIGGQIVIVFLLVAVLSYSRRLFVKAFLNQRQDDWREGIGGAFMHFGGVTLEVLGDNAKALVVAHDRKAGAVTFHPVYREFCRDWGVEPKACGPYRARTKGKTESGVKYVKRNALAGRAFGCFADLEAHLGRWMVEADQREHGTTHEAPLARFERDERWAMRPLPARPLPRRQQRLQRRVAADALVDVDTVRYSVPHRLVREHVEVLVGEEVVSIFRGTDLVATHRRSREPYARVVDAAHWEGLWRVRSEPEAPPPASQLAVLGRSLDAYAAVVEGEAA